ncbi:metacaspase-1-like isoform X1 [Actinidia eriantha]|uniref:metacaspase-1-like isoform X1 n=1 Tax=Actinidia eriantha TaxID=165200 RepID=UPI00258F0487|nr:metacaspase-1-like isoform X1 [Actinidia eriantha]
MAGRRERCSWCRVQLLVPPEVQSIQCPVCRAVTRIQPNDPLGQAQDSIYQATNWVKGFIKTVSSNINTMATSTSNYPMPGTYDYGHRPQRILPPPLLLPFSAHGTKRALLCGVSYYGRSYKLKGSVNDVRCMKFLLVERLRFPSESILVLTEEETDPRRIPTKYNIRMALQWLVQGCQSGDSLVFHYSGHGSQLPDMNGDEMDGYDETLCPLDYKTEGMILDDEINDTIVRPLPHGAKLHAIIDACHSGTVLDLPFVCRMNREGYYMWEDHSRLSATNKGTSGGLALLLSACDDHQITMDTTAFSGYAATGALTYSFIQAVQNEPGLTYGRLVNAMRYAIRDAKAGPLLNGPIASFVRKALKGAEISKVGFSCVIFIQLFLSHGSTWNNYKGGQFWPID